MNYDILVNMKTKAVRVRFAPSPSGHLHVGNIRTALFVWAYARHNNGTFILRIEDTDTVRVTPEYIASAQESLDWLGLDWDEGPNKNGNYGPYLQSERLDTYDYWAKHFLDNGDAYLCFCTQEELAASRNESKEANLLPGYNGHCRNLTVDQIKAYQRADRTSVIHMRMDDGETRFNDLIRGEIVFDNKFIPDFVLMRSDGSPLYPLAVAVDDILMKVTHILRGEDLLSSTPRQIRVYKAMGVLPEDYPLFAHLPFVMGSDNTKLSKRHGEVSIDWYRKEGFLPETVCNYLALLGWSPGDNRENITMEELVKLFKIEDVNLSPARFDLKKMEALNAEKIRALSPSEFFDRALPYALKANLFKDTNTNRALFREALPMLPERITRLSQIPNMLKFLFIDTLSIDPILAIKYSNKEAVKIINTTIDCIGSISDWNETIIHDMLKIVLVDNLGIKARLAFATPRVALTGSEISPPLFKSIELLGKEVSLERLRRFANLISK